MQAAAAPEVGFHNHPRLVIAQHKFHTLRESSIEAAQEFLGGLLKARNELEKGVKKASRELVKGFDLGFQKFKE